ncbi:MAG: type II toxin-antitoxin system RelE/ParE family toxin [Neorhizobium sp.]|nr:type II toxin-antitoxin system RelE/ParE family toxin [Neorhizobium sp.]
MKSREPVWSTAARADLFAHHDYIARDNPLGADRFFLDIYRKVERYSRTGLTGTNRGEFGNGIRGFSYRQRVIFFTVSDTALTILRVVHGHQDISPDFFKTDEN